MQQETEQFLDDVTWRRRSSAIDFTAPYTFLNGQMAAVTTASAARQRNGVRQDALDGSTHRGGV